MIIKLRKGLDIKLEGLPERVLPKCAPPVMYAVKPTDFRGLTPRLLLDVGAAVKAGTPVLADKYRPALVVASPVSGTVREVVRGERRKLLQVLIEPDSKDEAVPLAVPDVATAGRDELVQFLLASGAWPYLVQRPYGTLADPAVAPRDIFISGFDTAPLAADADYLLNGEGEAFQRGVDVLRRLTDGAVHLSLCADYPANNALERARGVVFHRIRGPHPAGNVGVQIHHIAPLCKGDVVWTIAPQHVMLLGKLMLTGSYCASKLVALAGPEVKKPRYYRLTAGACLSGMAELLNDEGRGKRVISGNVLTGENVGLSGYLGFYHNEISVIAEGDYSETLGWLMPRLNKLSASRSYFSWLMPSRRYALDTNLNGSQRAFVVSGQYEKVLPMRVLPVYLLKAILAGNVERMEQLGIYEVVEEDLALCEFVCTSKIEVQQILRSGIEMMMNDEKAV